MLRTYLSLVLMSMVVFLWAQDPATLNEEGRRLEQKLKDDEALVKYKEALNLQPSNLRAALKCAELTMNAGVRQADVLSRPAYYQQARTYLDQALRIDSNSVDAYFLLSVLSSRQGDIEKKNEQLVRYVKDAKTFADKAIALNPDYGKAYHALGQWNLTVMEMNSVKKTALKLLYGSLPEANIDNAISLMEKCKTLEPYYCANFLDLGKAYHFNKKYEKAIAVLEQLAKLPTRRQDDVAIKAEGAALLLKLQ